MIVVNANSSISFSYIMARTS